ncbi:hypothetical protein ENROMM299B_12695 [Enterobacter roggenkampii]
MAVIKTHTGTVITRTGEKQVQLHQNPTTPQRGWLAQKSITTKIRAAAVELLVSALAWC